MYEVSHAEAVFFFHSEFGPEPSQSWVELNPRSITQTWALEPALYIQINIFFTSFKCNTTPLFFLLCIAENIPPPTILHS